MRRLRHILLATLSVSAVAGAHDADVIYARLELRQETLDEVLTLTAPTLLQLAPVDADGDQLLTQADLDARGPSLVAGVWDEVPLTAGGAPCTRSDERAKLEEGFVSLSARWSCPAGDLRQDFKILRVLPTNYRVVLGSQFEGERDRRFAQGVFTALEVPRPRPPTLLDPAGISIGFVRGLQDCGVIEALALLFVLLLGAGTLRAAIEWLLLVLLGGVVVLAGWSPPGVIVPLALAGATLLAAFHQERRAVALTAALLSGVALALRATVLLRAEALGWWLGLVVVALVVGAISLPLGRLMARRPRAWKATRLVLVLLVLFSVGLRLGQ